MSYSEFLRLFPDNEACLDYLKVKFYADGTGCRKCGKTTKFHRIKGRSAYSCQYCGHHVYPTAGTIFHKSTTSLQLWFFAIYLMSSTRCGISAKQLEREIGTTYKTALRMFRQIRTLLDEDHEPLSGQVEIDEMYVGGYRRHAGTRGGRPGEGSGKTAVLGMVERGGRVRALTVPNAKADTLLPLIAARVLPASMIFTDELHSYKRLSGMGYTHRRIPHSEKVYVLNDVHTNAIEGFWSLVKNGIRGVYHNVSGEYLQLYLDEYAWRYNHRHDVRPMFRTILDQVQRPAASAA